MNGKRYRKFSLKDEQEYSEELKTYRARFFFNVMLVLTFAMIIFTLFSGMFFNVHHFQDRQYEVYMKIHPDSTLTKDDWYALDYGSKKSLFVHSNCPN